MATLWQLLRGRTNAASEVSRYSFSEWANDRLDAFQFGGRFYPLAGVGHAGTKAEQIESSFTGYSRSAFKANAVVFAAIVARANVFSEARFQFQQLRDDGNGRPGKLFGNEDLALLEQPWPNGSTGELLARMEQDASLAGNFFAVREAQRLRRLRPDWVTIILTAPPDEAVQSDVAGYAYQPGGFGSRAPVEFYLPDEVCHWSPTPDPEAQYRGMSWITPVIREIQADGAATTHKLKFFENGAVPSIVASFKETVADDDFEAFVEEFKSSSVGLANAYKPLFLAGGADVTVVGADLRQLDFASTQGAGEVRIAAAARIHPVILGIHEGLQGSSLNEGNYRAAKRNFVDGEMCPRWRSACAALSTLVTVPDDARLWYDDRDIPFLREDRLDAAEIMFRQAQTIRQLADGGYEQQSAVAAVVAGDLGLLKHTGLFSVQLQPAGTQQPAAVGAGGGDDPKALPAQAARSDLDDLDDDEDGDPDEDTLALVYALNRLAPVASRAWDPAKHPKIPKGQPGAGRFMSVVDRVTDSVKAHLAGSSHGDPFEGFTREQLRKAAKARGIALKRGISREDIAKLLLADLAPRHRPKKQHDIAGIPVDVRKDILAAYKAQPQGQLLSSPASHSFDNLVAVAHVYGKRTPEGQLSTKQVARIIDEQLAHDQQLKNHNLLEKKLGEWLATAEGASYAKSNQVPKKSIVGSLTGKVSLPEGVALEPGDKVQKVSGPGRYKATQTDFTKHTGDQMQALQDKYLTDSGVEWTPDQLAAQANYTGGGNVAMNKYLRGSKSATAPPLVRQQVVDLQSAMYPIPENTLLVRGTGWEQLPLGFRSPELAKKLIGKTIEDPGFVSTSVAGSGGNFGGPVRLQIEAPAGTHGVFVKKVSYFASENEWLLAAGTKFRVVSVEDTGHSVVMRVRVVTPK